MSVKEWCSKHEIAVANYYYRFKEVVKTCLEHFSYDAFPQSIILVPAELMSVATQSVYTSRLEVSINNICIHVTNVPSPELLKMVLKWLLVLNDATLI